MTVQDVLPGPVLDLLTSASVAEYVTVSAAGVPIDTPVLFFPSADLSSIDLATGLSYPAKAERARRNPKVGLLIEGGRDEPIVSIAGMAAVRDANLQANVLRYLSEAAHTLPYDPDWSLAQQAVWYWTRILVEIVPVKIEWWDNAETLDGPPQRWEAPAGAVFPASDPAPKGTGSKAAKWDERPWQALATQALGRAVPGHLSVVDVDGYPRAIRARSIVQTKAGFALDLPRGLPWTVVGKACLTFGGLETFIGEVRPDGEMAVERTLPLFPMTEDQRQLWEPTADTREQLMRRLTEETGRRGQPIPRVPAERPEPTAGYRRRLERIAGTAGLA
jgi:hypothetical protein